MANYYISDLHLFHKNVTDEGVNFDSRPFATLEEMHEEIKKRWNDTVSNADHVYILGDLAWKENEDVIQLVSTLRGNKHLILGNHDRVKDCRYRQLFVEITNYKEIKDTANGKEYRVIMSHFPMAFWNRQHHYQSVQLYGHVHNSNEETIFQDFINKLNGEYNIECIARNVGCMHDYMNYCPQSLNKILG